MSIEDDEALRRIARIEGHQRNPVDDDRVVLPRDPQIIGGGERLLAQIVEGKARHAHRCVGYAYGAPLERKLLRAVVPAGKPPPRTIERGVGGGVGRRVPYRHAGELLQTEVGTRREPDHVHMLFDHLDERHEQGAVQAVLVERLGRHVGGGDHDAAALEQLREQPAEDHRIGDVGDVEFIEAEQPGLLRQVDRGKPDRVLAGVLAELHLLPEGMNALVHVDHEFVEVHAALARDRARFEEEIHQHRLAAPDVAVDVDALDRRLLAPAGGKQPAER